MKIMSLITHPHVIPRPSFIFWTQIKIFLMNSENFLTLYRQQGRPLEYHEACICIPLLVNELQRIQVLR